MVEVDAAAVISHPGCARQGAGFLILHDQQPAPSLVTVVNYTGCIAPLDGIDSSQFPECLYKRKIGRSVVSDYQC